jgi:hypothetical protein
MGSMEGGSVTAGLEEKNRAHLARVFGWPPDAVAECQQLERDHPDYSARWTDGKYPADNPPGPGFQAQLLPEKRGESGGIPPTLHAATAEALSDLLTADEQRRQQEAAAHRRAYRGLVE